MTPPKGGGAVEGEIARGGVEGSGLARESAGAESPWDRSQWPTVAAGPAGARDMKAI